MENRYRSFSITYFLLDILIVIRAKRETIPLDRNYVCLRARVGIGDSNGLRTRSLRLAVQYLEPASPSLFIRSTRPAPPHPARAPIITSLTVERFRRTLPLALAEVTLVSRARRRLCEHVWQVTLQPRGLGKGSKGIYRLCLNDNTVCLVRLSSLVPQFSIPLVTIRSVAFSECVFRMDVGKYAPTGEGEFSLSVDDSSTAKDMHNTILHYMNSVKNPSSHKDSHRRSSECQVSPGHRRPASIVQRPASYYPPPGQTWTSLDPASPTSLGYPMEFNTGSHRTRSDTGDSHKSRASSHFDDHGQDFGLVYNGGDMTESKEQISVVPADMSPPSSPTRLDDEVVAYVEMDMGKQRPSSSSLASGVSTPPSAIPTPLTSSLHSHKGELPAPSEAYIPMVPHHGQTPQLSSVSSAHMPTAPIPIHSHSYSDPHHSTPLPTVREGGSNEGYVPMDSSSPASSLGSVVRPGPAKCMLSDDSTGMHPRTYSLGSKPPGKKFSSYVEMGPGGAAGKGPNDMPRATSVPHIILKGGARRDRDSPTTSASPLSMSLKSDDSVDSFMEYMPMRPRTASDSFNYNRPRTASFGNKASSGTGGSCRPRSSSHGQGTRPFLGGRLGKEIIKQEPVPSLLLRGDHHRVSSQTSSPHGSFDSLRVSNESLRRLSLSEAKPGNLSRQQSGSNASDYSDARGTPSPKALRADADGYVNMQPGSAGGGAAAVSGLGLSSSSSSTHRLRTDSASSSGRRSDSGKASSSDRLHHQNKSDYAEMAPLKSSGSIGSATAAKGEAYISMDFRTRHSFSSDTRPNMQHITSSHTRQQTPSITAEGAYINMDMSAGRGQVDQGRSVSMENVESYVMYDPAQPKVSSSNNSSGLASDGKPRTGSLGSKDKKGVSGAGIPRPGASRKPSSNSTSSIGGSSIGLQHGGHSAAVSTRTGGSSDSLRSKSNSSSRQSSMEKFGSLGKDFRKKSASMGSRPVSKSGSASGSKSLSFSSRGDGGTLHPREQYQQQQPQQQLVVHSGNLIPVRKTQQEMQEETADEYIEFAPTVTLQEHVHHPHGHGATTTHLSSPRSMPPSSTSGSFNVSRSPTSVPSLPISDENDSGYTMYNPALPPELLALSPSSGGMARMAHFMAGPSLHPLPQASYIQGQQPSTSRHHQQLSLGHFPSSSAQPKSLAVPTSFQPSAKDDSEYVGYEPGMAPTSHNSDLPASSITSAQAKVARPVVEAKADSEYVGYEPGDIPATQSAEQLQATSPGLPKSDDVSEYVGYNPSTPSSISSSLIPSKPLSPESAVSYIQGGPASKVNPIPGQPRVGPITSATSTSTMPSSSPTSPRPKPGQQSPSSLPSHSPTSPAVAVPQDDSEYIGYNPAVPDTASANSASKVSAARKPSSTCDSSNVKENVMPTPARAVSYIQGTSVQNDVASPLKVDVGSGERNTRASSTPPLSSNDNTPAIKRNSKNNSSQHKQKTDKQDRLKQQALSTDYSEPQHQKLTANFHRAMSSPSGSTSDFPSPSSQGAGLLDCPSPSSSGPSPTGSSRQKHSSDSSNSSQKSKRGVSSSSDSLRGDKISASNKSDSNSSLNSSTSSLKGSSKRRAPSDSSSPGGWGREDRAPGASMERSPLSPVFSTSSRGDRREFFGGEVCSLSSEQLEAKIVPVESRIRHSLGDMTTMVGEIGAASKEASSQQVQGLVRPGSTPCMHQLDASSGGAGSSDNSGGLQSAGSAHKSSGDNSDGSSSGSNANSRSRHSLSDLNMYQQQQQPTFTPGTAGSVAQSGSETAGTGVSAQMQQQQQPKPLNYVKLDLSASQECHAGGNNSSGGDNGKANRSKSRNSSDADEKQPAVSYAEIDFVKSQNLTKALAMAGGSGDQPSKS
ncbi:LOW QUALITY PROTEIN: insulin receptor substrate 1 [Plakobranchus ocellatus]|uniref:Insulin receptor substrate 1 n=1 Tax=Plakobranchus ocellatus TaxID=259542 RepID=A0AAV4ACC2_9GAST|nr:LOW QUALITY PROTEIN: insulin receptor substrate 1 [Plakobranchus ocellatus]